MGLRSVSLASLEAELKGDNALTVEGSFRESLTQFGAVILVDHGLDIGDIESVLRACGRIHSLPAEEQLRLRAANRLAVRGLFPCDDVLGTDHSRLVVKRHYVSFEFGYPSVGEESAGTARYVLGAPNVLPTDDMLSATIADYYAKISECSKSVSRTLSLLIGEDASFLESKATSPCSQLRLLHYPPSEVAGEIMLGEHTDYECFTLIVGSNPALEVKSDDGSWISVVPPAGSLTLLLGDLIEVLTDGHWPAALHRVRSSTNTRHSAVFFYGLDYDEMVSPVRRFSSFSSRRYPSVHVGTHLTGMSIRNFSHLQRAIDDGQLAVPFEVASANPLKTFRASLKTANADSLLDEG